MYADNGILLYEGEFLLGAYNGTGTLYDPSNGAVVFDGLFIRDVPVERTQDDGEGQAGDGDAGLGDREDKGEDGGTGPDDGEDKAEGVDTGPDDGEAAGQPASPGPGVPS